MILYFAGADANLKYNSILVKNGINNKLESYYSLGSKQPSIEFPNLLIDSGGFAARTRNVFISVVEYAAYLNKYQIKLAFNLDTNDTRETLSNQAYLIKNTATRIIPIYHMSDWSKRDYLLDKFIADGFQYIGLGGMAGTTNSNNLREDFFNHCFSRTRDKIKIHGLGVTSQTVLEKYPFYSVDSTSWLSSARYGNSISKDKVMIQMKARVRHYLDNTSEETKRWLKVEHSITELWKLRGVQWA